MIYLTLIHLFLFNHIDQTDIISRFPYNFEAELIIEWTAVTIRVGLMKVKTHSQRMTLPYLIKIEDDKSSNKVGLILTLLISLQKMMRLIIQTLNSISFMVISLIWSRKKSLKTKKLFLKSMRRNSVQRDWELSMQQNTFKKSSFLS